MDDISGRSIRTQHDLHRLWRELVGDVGVSGTSLWFAVIEPDGALGRQLVHIDEVPDLPDVRGLGGLVAMLGELAGASGPGTSVAFLRSRPGSSRITRADRAWAEGLIAETSRADVLMWPMHLATDESLGVMADVAEDTPA